MADGAGGRSIEAPLAALITQALMMRHPTSDK